MAQLYPKIEQRAYFLRIIFILIINRIGAGYMSIKKPPLREVLIELKMSLKLRVFLQDLQFHLSAFEQFGKKSF